MRHKQAYVYKFFLSRSVQKGPWGEGMEGEGEGERTRMASLAFKLFPGHVCGAKGVSTSDAGDGRCYALRLCTGASMSDADA